jgi:hypothetical protein
VNVKRLINAARRRATLPHVRQWVRGMRDGTGYVPPVGMAWLGNLRRLTPISRNWGE